MKRYLDQSNEAPVYTMWQELEPLVESVRRGLAREFGCDPEEMAITRNASEALEAVQLGLDLKHLSPAPPPTVSLTRSVSAPLGYLASRTELKRTGCT